MKSNFQTLPIAARILILMIALSGATAAAFSVNLQPAWDLARLTFFVVLAVATARAKVKLSGTSSLSLLTATVLLSLMVGGPAVAVVSAVCGVVTQTLLPNKKIVLHQLVFNIGMIALAATLAGWAYQVTNSANGGSFSSRFLGSLAAAFVYFLGNSVLVSMIVAFTKGGSIARIWTEHFAPAAPSFLIAGMVSLVALELLPYHTMMLVSLAIIAPVYYSSIRLASYSSVAAKV